jgi:ABC-type nitrate/sulfonate/bicarbonate transport system substrate-binding protein
VEFVDPLGRGPEGLVRLGEGGADLALGSVQYLVAARARLGRPTGVRFVAALHQRSPLAAFVPEDSLRRVPADLAGARVACSTAPWFDAEFRAGMEYLGVAPPLHVGPGPLGTRPSLARREVDAIGSWEDAVAVVRERAGIPVRAIPFGPDVYTTGLLAADSLPGEVVGRVAAALAAALVAQRERPDAGVAELCARFPTVAPGRVAEEWSVLTRYLFGPEGPGAMRADQWAATLEHTARVQGLPRLDVGEACREDLLGALAPATRA